VGVDFAVVELLDILDVIRRNRCLVGLQEERTLHDDDLQELLTRVHELLYG